MTKIKLHNFLGLAEAGANDILGRESFTLFRRQRMRHSKLELETGNGFDFVVVIALFALLYNYLRMVCIHHKHKLPEHFIIS